MSRYQEIIDKYYFENNKAKEILITHGKVVCNKIFTILHNKPELKIDKNFIEEACMLHDIGIVYTNSPKIGCFGTFPYICHGYLGRELLEKENLDNLALIAERHTGAGLSENEIVIKYLPLPHRDMIPITIEEQIVCFADKFFSKSKNITKEASLSEIRAELSRYGNEQVSRFNQMCEIFL